MKLKMKYNTFKGLYNFNHGKAVLDNKPEIQTIELTNACNLRCVMCPMNTGGSKRPKTYMTRELFKHIVDNYHDQMNIVCLFFHGEPLMHPDLKWFLDYLNMNNLKGLIYTNATLLDNKISRMLLERLYSISFSFDSLDEKTYEKIRVGADYGKVVKNIIRFVDMKNKMKVDTYVSVRATVMDDNKNDITKLTEYFKNMKGVDEVDVSEIHSWSGKIDTKKFIRDEVRMEDVPCCIAPWTQVQINCQGDVMVCCAHEDNPFGNISEQPLQEIWNNEKYVSLRKAMLRGKLKGTVCEKCSFRELNVNFEPPNRFFPFTFKYIKRISSSLRQKMIKDKIRIIGEKERV